MPEVFLELFSEEIPARMQSRAAEDLGRLTAAALAGLSPAGIRTWFGPRRIALAAEIDAHVASAGSAERGPRINAPEQALLGFLRKHNATKDQARQEGDYWVLEKPAVVVEAKALIAGAIPDILRKMPWPKSMRWGDTSHFSWVRPLRRIVCLLDGQVVPFDLRDGADDGHVLLSGHLTEGHRFHAPGAFAVSNAADWAFKLGEHRVIVDAAERKQSIAVGLAQIATEKGIVVVEDSGLLDEVAGLVEWPVPLAGWIAAEHMSLPPEVMQVSMRVHLRYFATRTAGGEPSPWFLFVANVEADDGGAAIVAGNERVLRARFSDAQHFWDLDREVRLESRLPALDHVTYHAKLGSQGARVTRLRRLAAHLAPMVGAGPGPAERAAELAKADLITGMVGEFPELQGVMGRYYAAHDREDAAVADAIRDHYAPRGPMDPVPTAPVSMAVALADKIDQLACFFVIGERPTGAGDPYALRRAALGVIRIIRDNGVRITLLPLLDQAVTEARNSVRSVTMDSDTAFSGTGDSVLERAAAAPPVPEAGHKADPLALDILEFLKERLRVQLRTEGARHDILTAVLGAAHDDDIVRVLARMDAVTALLGHDDGANLLAAYRRAANILRVEERKDGPHDAAPRPDLLAEAAEQALHAALGASEAIGALVAVERYSEAMAAMARLREPMDRFFETVTVNAGEPELRRNRLRLLNRARTTMDCIADFSRIEG